MGRTRLDEQYSQKAEEKRQAKGKKRKLPKTRRKGRISTAEKTAKAKRTELVYPKGFAPEQCKFSHTRVVWRFEEGRAALIAYEIYRCGNSFGKPSGLLGRSEYGIDILVSLAYQVYVLGLSLDKACKVMCFFQSLQLTKSQADSLLNLVHESMRLMLVQELFVFVTSDGVDGNNNVSERELRDDAHRRVTGRTNKTPRGARRQTILSSVLRTLAKQLSSFTLDSVIDEVKRWLVKGRGCFSSQVNEAGLNPSATGSAKIISCPASFSMWTSLILKQNLPPCESEGQTRPSTPTTIRRSQMKMAGLCAAHTIDSYGGK